MQTVWGEGILRLPSCHQEFGEDGKLIQAGPRVRMGIHLATKGDFSRVVNKVTKHVQFVGRA
eukprot:1216103-Pyramimonas_sp.AAC.1